MDKAEALHIALHTAEAALGRAVERYRLALGCCRACGDFFEPGALAVAMVDAKGRTEFEHQFCPDGAEDYGSSYRNEQQTNKLP